eukprot:gnl/MRDRNA2_/MRDRNA2_30062_c0_seq1.p1 gnl/MRDRNA2_/MRDRNA2_30062_c0~~gnl/MRDRNA2_/MRDRNA2_30062_c0_seq1.p1  ORF type:complete len:612 (+),score=111.21 gnl/MRDRNA2_/MRDRNA2_30062_c0_seq1:189-2024(+)
MLKLVRMMKAAKFLDQLKNNVAISFAKISLIKVSVGLALISHWIACFWGMIGKLYGTSLECKPDSHEPIWHHSDDNSGVSWIYSHYYLDGHRDSPCNPWHLYASSLHFSIMTISSIGHGDITPTRVEEYYLCCLCMLTGAITWAYTIGTMSGAIWSLDPQTNYFEGVMDNLNYMVRDEEMPDHLRVRLREHFNDCRNQMKNESYLELKQDMSETLLGDVILQENYRWLRKVWYFKHCHRDFMVEVSSRMMDMLYAARERVNSEETLCILRRGVVAYPGQILTAGSFWGDDMILDTKSLRVRCETMAVTFVEISGLKRKSLMESLQDHPYEWKFINKARVKLAVIRGVIKQAVELRQQLKEAGEDGPHHGPVHNRCLSSFFATVALTNLIEEKADENGLIDSQPDDSQFSVTGGCRSPDGSPSPNHRKAKEMSRSMSDFQASMRAAANASAEGSDPAPSAPDTDIPGTNAKKDADENLQAPKASEVEEICEPVKMPELEAAIASINLKAKEELVKPAPAPPQDWLHLPMQFPPLPETFDVSALNRSREALKHSNEPIHDALQFSPEDMQRIADAIAFKVEKQPSLGRSSTVNAPEKKTTWRLRGGVKRFGTM